MHAFQPESFAILSPAKAKVAALALFDSAMIEPAADWRGVAFALHAVVSRKRGASVSMALDEIAMGDAADASEYVAWADYPATGKAANIARGRVTVTFADGWTKTVGMLAGKTAKGRKPWSIAAAVRFAVVCYKIAAVRRATGSDSALYFHKGGDESGITVTLNGLVAAPEIVSVISADSAETVEGDLIWNPDDANAFTLDQRAGLVHIPLALAPMPAGIAVALREARQGMIARMGLVYVASYALAREAAERVTGLLWPSYATSRSSWEFHCFDDLIEAEPDAYPWDAAHMADFAASPGLAEMAGVTFDTPHAADAPADDEIAADCLSPAALVEAACEAVKMGDDDADAPAYDGEALLVAMEIVGAYDDDAFCRWLAPSTWSDRRINIEDALIAWPGEVEPAMGIPMTDQEPQVSPQEPDAPVCATHVAETPGARPYSISEARYAKGKMVIHCPSSDGYKTHAGYLAEQVGGRYVGRSRGYHVSAKQAAKFERLYAAGEVHGADTTVAATIAAVEPAKPVAKPRYRYSPVSGAWELVEPAGEVERLAA